LRTGDLRTGVFRTGDLRTGRFLTGAFFRPRFDATTISYLLATFFSADNKMKDILMSRNRKEAIYNLLVFILYVFILTFFIRFLWNKSLVKYITILKPVDSLWHTFVLAIALSILKC